jgi:hypothetical protein
LQSIGVVDRNRAKTTWKDSRMSWGNPEPAVQSAIGAICEAPNCNNAATVVIDYGGQEKPSCIACCETLPILRVIDGVPFDEATRTRLINDWEASKTALEVAKNSEMERRKAVFAYAFPNPTEGTQRVELGGGYSLKAVHKINTKITASNEAVDQAEDAASKCGNEGTFLFERIITWTPNFSKSEYKKLEADNPTHIQVKKLVDSLIEETPGAPTLDIEAPKAKLTA